MASKLRRQWPKQGARLAALRCAAGLPETRRAGPVGKAQEIFKKKAAEPDRWLERRMQQIERRSPREKRQVLQLVDAFIERELLRSARG